MKPTLTKGDILDALQGHRSDLHRLPVDDRRLGGEIRPRV